MPLRDLATFTAPSCLNVKASEAPFSRYLNEQRTHLVTLPSGLYLQIYSLDTEYQVPLARVLVAIDHGGKYSCK